MACKKWYMGTNTKAYKTIQQTVSFVERLEELTADIDRSSFELFVIPSYTALESANLHSSRSAIKLGAQNMVWEEQGQFTGEISPIMLTEVGCDLVMIGHAERRSIFFETDAMENRKVLCALAHGFTTLLCIGESAEEKFAGRSIDALQRQISLDLKGVSDTAAAKLYIAYEPTWAIGVNGGSVAVDYVDEHLSVIRDCLKHRFGQAGADIPVLYGGSVNRDNAVQLSRCRDINGLFIGRSAWDADNFNQIIRDVLEARD